ncbi:hypothetical protein [Kitasatospora viridis]|uniref:Uncharacterized protein n=1 Tax=Kitasatospora viridis TaxID=281105 RepID=A0A561SA42_9ACTN|nr:hypothetical protein [Kitasatospora viridis]TWF71742.1 hypothetical protein FHX73_18113 [Kitasatospora viridis]
MSSGQQPISLAELASVHARLLASQEWSKEQARQLNMVVRQLERAVTSGELPPETEVSLSALLTGRGQAEFRRLAKEGAFRDPSRRPAKDSSTSNSGNVRTLWVERLAAQAGIEITEYVPYDWEAQQPVSGQQLRMFQGLLLQHAQRPTGSLEWQRFVAMAHVVVESAPRSGELAALFPDDFGADRRSVWLQRNPQRVEGLGERERVDLSPVAARAVRQWESGGRASLTAGLTGGRVGMWVTLAANHRHGVSLRAGVTLQEIGLHKAWRRGIRTANGVLSAWPGWPGPMPVRMECMRLGVLQSRESGLAA